MSLVNLVRQHQAELIELRRDLHRYPEIGFDLPRTTERVCRELKAMGLPLKDKIGRSGIFADLVVDPAAPTIALRADMDALPMQELRESEYKSTIDGQAHMCGHDAHTAMLLTAAKILKAQKDLLKVNVRFVFQPNEENLPGGAPFMIEDGVLEGVDEIFGLHVWPLIKSGQLGLCQGAAMAQPDCFRIKIIGKGGHAALPHLCVDPIYCGATLVSQLQSLVSRNTDPLKNAVLSITEFHGGETHNVISESVKITGTLRSLEPSLQKDLKSKLFSVLEAVTRSCGARFEIDYQEGYPVLVNDDGCNERVLASMTALVGEENTHYPLSPSMGGEDFAYYAKKIPASFFFLGVGNEDKDTCYMCHHPQFDVDEEALYLGVAMHCHLALNYKNKECG